MMTHPIRGRPAGRLTIAKRKALDYVLAREASGEPIILNQLMRACGFSCRANAKRTLKGLRDMGLVS